ncbi:MAG: hypothetical protein F4213_20795, partial [Boseongicola sp. SB0677_bin_26]|nr:hypothetical protein [Boseongicola sp. SB0677_bin_26]
MSMGSRERRKPHCRECSITVFPSRRGNSSTGRVAVCPTRFNTNNNGARCPPGPTCRGPRREIQMNYLRSCGLGLLWATGSALAFAAVAANAEPAHGTLVVAVNQEPQDLAAQGTYKEINATGLRNVVETLIAVDPVSGEMRGVLATGWERIDGSTLRFTIRQGVKFHDGTELTAEAVAKSINWVWSPEKAFTIQEYAGPGEITATAIDE